MTHFHIRLTALLLMVVLVLSGCGQTVNTPDEPTTESVDHEEFLDDRIEYVNEELGIRLLVPSHYTVNELENVPTFGVKGDVQYVQMSEGNQNALDIVAASIDHEYHSEGSVAFARVWMIDMSSESAFTESANDAFLLDDDEIFAARKESENQMNFFSIEGYGERYLAYNALFRYPQLDGTYAYLRLRSAPIVQTEAHFGIMKEVGSDEPIDPEQIAIDLMQNNDHTHRQDIFNQFLLMTHSLEFISNDSDI